MWVMAAASSNRKIRTGLYDIDLNCPELRKEGVRVPLQEQPFRVLSLLLEHPGEVVTREDLQTRLWASDTYVAFDEGINTAIRKLRLAFGDSADNPRFIETLPRRGYRFIAPVHEVTFQGVPSATTANAIAPIASGVDTAEVAVSQAGESGSRPIALDLSSHVRFRKLAAGLVLAVIVVGGTIYWTHGRRPTLSASPGKRVMLAILPFQNLSNDPSQEYFSDGLTEETITDLGELSPERLGVIARTSAMAYKHANKTVSEIGSELGVDYILEGSVRREGGRARVSAQLIRVGDQTHLWARNYDRELNNVLEFENDLGRAIAEEVQANLTPERQTGLARQRVVDPEAYDLYLKGRYYWNERTPAGIKQSIGYFQKATAKDPNFALAYAGLADAYNIGNILGVYSAKDSLPHAAEAAMKAIELDPSLAEAHAALGMEKSHYEFDFSGAEREFKKAIELNSNSAYAHLFYSNCYLLPMGREAEAVGENQKAVALDPLSLPINNFLGATYSFVGDYEKSYRQFQHTLEMDPRFPLAHAYFAGLLFAMGKVGEAIEENEKTEVLSGESPEKAAAEAAAMRQAFKSGGERRMWQHQLDMVLQKYRSVPQSVFASELAGAYARAGHVDQAFKWLTKAYDERDGEDITLIKYDFSFKNLRKDPRYAAFQRRMGLPE